MASDNSRKCIIQASRLQYIIDLSVKYPESLTTDASSIYQCDEMYPLSQHWVSLFVLSVNNLRHSGYISCVGMM